MSSHYVLNCFNYFLIYILGQNVSKTLDKKNYIKSSYKTIFVKMTRYSQRFLNYIILSVAKCVNTLKFYTH